MAGNQDIYSLSHQLEEATLASEDDGSSTIIGLPADGDFRHEEQALSRQDWDSAITSEQTSSESSLGPCLSDEQQRILEKVREGYSVFFTGAAGTGKSILLMAIINALRPPKGDSLAVTASTGVAACNINGMTLHAFAGFGLGKEPMAVLPHRICESNKRRWRRTQVLIIDEISMIDGLLFDKVEYVARVVRNNPLPFGGLQLVLSGDFFQLPPVSDMRGGVPVPATFAFDAKTWDKCVGPPTTLTKVFRQENQVFVDLLNNINIRLGKLSRSDDVKLLSLNREVQYDDGAEPTELFPLRSDVDRSNTTRLASLPGPTFTYRSLDIPGVDIRGRLIPQDKAEQMLEKQVNAVQVLTLKIGAHVMLVKNLNVCSGLVNGSVGIVEGFRSTISNSHTANGSGHDSTNLTIDIRSPDDGYRSPNVWPYVKFQNGHEMLCIPEKFSIENANRKEEATRIQVPLILAWALSIHKSQGSTIERVKTDFAKIFEKGQAYVALSRATKLETLQILHYSRSKINPHPRVIKWDEENKQRAAFLRETDEGTHQ